MKYFREKYPGEAAADLVASCLYEELFPTGAAEKAAYYLFDNIREQLGVEEARRIFLKFGKDPSPTKLKKIKNAGVLDRYDMMKPRPNIAELARQMFAENQALPSGQRSTTTLTSIEKHITRLKDEREKRRSKRPVPNRTI
jgi:hypothetical protein